MPEETTPPSDDVHYFMAYTRNYGLFTQKIYGHIVGTFDKGITPCEALKELYDEINSHTSAKIIVNSFNRI